MDGMAPAPAHAKPARRDLLWVLVAILACGLLEVWASWLQIGSVSGFPKLGRMTTGWILPVTSEAYWTVALYAWLVAPAGPRSKRFAMWSAIGVFFLSVTGQESDHLMAFAHRAAPPVGVVMFVTALPLVAVALIAVLIHLRHLDREEAAQADRVALAARQEADAEAAADDERTAMRAELGMLREALETAQAAAVSAGRAAAESAAKMESMSRKIAAMMEAKRRSVSDSKGRQRAPKNGQAEGIPLQLKAANLMDEKPHLRAPRMGGELARELGVSTATGTRLHKLLTAEDSPGESISDGSANQSDDRSGNQS